MPEGHYRKLVKLLAAADFCQDRGWKGSHEKWHEPTYGRMVIVPKFKGRHTANEVQKQGGLQKGF